MTIKIDLSEEDGKPHWLKPRPLTLEEIRHKNRAKCATGESKMELRKFFGQSGKVYYVTWSKETHWHVFTESATECFSSEVARTAAIDCGATGGPTEFPTHHYWKQLWASKKSYETISFFSADWPRHPHADHRQRCRQSGDALRKEYNELQPKMHECMVAIEKAVRNNNIWQEENLTMEECKARGYQSIDLGNRMLQYGISPAPQEE